MEIIFILRESRLGLSELKAAVRFESLVVAQSSTYDLLGKVVSEERLLAWGGELLGDSVILDDSAYQCPARFYWDTSKLLF